MWTGWLLRQAFLWIIPLTSEFPRAAHKNAFNSPTRGFMIQGSKNHSIQDAGFRDLNLQWHCTKSALAVLFITVTDNVYLPPRMRGRSISVKCLLVPHVFSLKLQKCVLCSFFYRSNPLLGVGGMVDEQKKGFKTIFALVSVLWGERTMEWLQAGAME